MAVQATQNRITVDHFATVQTVHQGFINSTVVTAVKHQNFLATRDGSDPTQYKTIGITGTQGHLPHGQSKNFRQAFPHLCSTLGGQHAR